METCKICDRNSRLGTCSVCQEKSCETCLNSHQTFCSAMKEHHYHMCKVHRDQQVGAYCEQCSKLICEKCRYVDFKNHVIKSMNTAIDNFRKDMPMVRHELDEKYDHLKRGMEILEKEHSLSQQKMGTTTKPTNQHVLESLPGAKATVEILGKETFPLTFMSRWSYLMRALNECKQIQIPATESPQTHEQMSSHVPDVNQTFGSSEKNYDAKLVTLPPKGENTDDIEKISEAFANVVNMKDKPGMPSSTSGLPGGDVMVADFVNIPIETDTRELNDNRPPDKNQVEKLQKDKQQESVEGKQMEQMIKLHQQETTYILGMANSMVTRIDDIRKRKKTVKYSSLGRPQNRTLVSFVKDMELILNRVTDMKNDMLTTEGNLAAKIASVVKCTDEQRQTEQRLNQEIHKKAKTIKAQDKELKIKLSRIKKINSASDTLKNENNKLRQQIHDNQKKADQQQRNQSHKLEVENDGLKRSLNQMNTELQQRAAHIESLQRTLQDLTYQINKKDEQIRDVKRETDDLRTRLSSLAGDKVTKENPAITDLGDPNRPMKLAEKYGELYDNEWTDAMDCAEVKALYPDMKTAEIEEIIIRHLYQLVTCCYRECLALSKEQLEEVGNTIVNALKLNNEEHDRDIPGCKEVSKFRRQCAAEYADYLFKQKVIVDKIVLSDWEYVHKSNELVGLLTETPFFEKCVNLCWHMAIQDPVMHLDKELTPDTAYDKSVYREFVKSGDKVTFVVWPALFLHEGGPLLSKGVVQAYC